MDDQGHGSTVGTGVPLSRHLRRFHECGRTLGLFRFLSILIIPICPKNWATWSSVTLVGRPLRRANKGTHAKRRTAGEGGSGGSSKTGGPLPLPRRRESTLDGSGARHKEG